MLESVYLMPLDTAQGNYVPVPGQAAGAEPLQPIPSRAIAGFMLLPGNDIDHSDELRVGV